MDKASEQNPIKNPDCNTKLDTEVLAWGGLLGVYSQVVSTLKDLHLLTILQSGAEAHGLWLWSAGLDCNFSLNHPDNLVPGTKPLCRQYWHWRTCPASESPSGSRLPSNSDAKVWVPVWSTVRTQQERGAVTCSLCVNHSVGFTLPPVCPTRS